MLQLQPHAPLIASSFYQSIRYEKRIEELMLTRWGHEVIEVALLEHSSSTSKTQIAYTNRCDHVDFNNMVYYRPAEPLFSSSNVERHLLAMLI